MQRDRHNYMSTLALIATSIDNQQLYLKWKVKHRSAIEAISKAQKVVGGIIRDVFSMKARPVALLNSLRFGELQSMARVKFYSKK